MQARVWLVAAAVTVAAQASPMHERVFAQGAPGVIVSELRFRGPAGVRDEFIELFNAASQPVDIGGWMVWSSDDEPAFELLAEIPADTLLAPGCYYLLSGAAYSGGEGDLRYFLNLLDNGGVALTTPEGVVSDQVGLGTHPDAYGEGARLPSLADGALSYERRRSSAGYVDTNNNGNDFHEVSPATPQSTTSACVSAATVVRPHEVQGAGPVSPRTGNMTVVRGVVTARSAGGFFMQTEVGQEDSDANTSEGLFVAQAVPAELLGHVVAAAGTVAEVGHATRLNAVSSVTDLGASALPPAFVLTGADLLATGSPDQLERLEGMRVGASLTVVSPTELDGSFFAVLTGVARPFHEPGIETGAPALPCESAPCAFEAFDGNPERLRVDSDGINAAYLMHLSTNATVNAVGPLDYAAGAYTLLPESMPIATGGVAIVQAPSAQAGRFSVASMSLGNSAVDADAYTRRLAKASLMVRSVLNLPDIVAVQLAENSGVLSDLADRIDQDAAAAGQPAPGYSPQANGFLIKAARVSSIETAAVGEDQLDPSDASTSLFHQAPVMLRAVVDAGAYMPQHITVLNSQFFPLEDAGRNDASGEHARARRRAQAEWLASFINGRQANDPAEAIVVVGGFNAHAFNDGYVDVMGTVRGIPAPGDRVVLSSPHLVTPVLHDLTVLVAAPERYSSTRNGNAQALDHALVSPNLSNQFAGAVFARVNADFPAALAMLADDPRRLSDRDPLVLFFSFPGDVHAPVFDAAPGDRQVEATGPQGAVVQYVPPTATDNVDPAVVVSCAPASGSVFPVGNNAVQCSGVDAAGNQATAAFTVSVIDTTAPVLTVPADVTAAATSAAGRAITFAASARDAVSGPVAVSCVPGSGSTFKVGSTTVVCTAKDAAGNGAMGAFSVTVTPLPATLHGRMDGAGSIRSGSRRASFAFEVLESHRTERGWLVMLLKGADGRLRCFAASVRDVVFSNAPAYQPGRYPQNGVDTVVFSGTGHWNGSSNHRFEVTASDRGGHGAGRDTFSIVVKSPSGKIVESINGVLTDGNIESRRR